METRQDGKDGNLRRSEGDRLDAERADLTPNFLAGVNRGTLGPHPELRGRTLADVKDSRERLPDLSEADLKRIPVLPEGSRLEQGATYLDLANPQARPFVALGGMSAGPDSLIVPKANVDYVLWNRLSGVQIPERLDEAGPPA